MTDFDSFPVQFLKVLRSIAFAYRNLGIHIPVAQKARPRTPFCFLAHRLIFSSAPSSATAVPPAGPILLYKQGGTPYILGHAAPFFVHFIPICHRHAIRQSHLTFIWIMLILTLFNFHKKCTPYHRINPGGFQCLKGALHSGEFRVSCVRLRLYRSILRLSFLLRCSRLQRFGSCAVPLQHRL